MKQAKILVILGTRPEAVKMGPVIHHLQSYRHEIQTVVAATAQHRSMSDQTLKIFDIMPDIDLDIMRPNQSLTDITARSLQGLETVLKEGDYQMVLVQGDTTTAFVGSLAAFYQRIPISHIEAGLRTRSKYNPYPEEINRHFIDVLADLCFAPTETARNALLAEQVKPERILVTGNTVIDALLTTVKADYQFQTSSLHLVNFNSRRHTLLVTVHRRENHGAPLQGICQAFKQLLSIRQDVQLVWPVHLNPNVYHTVHAVLGGLEHVYLIDPLDYPDFVNLMARAHLILTDSGGVQEEAPSLGKPVLVMRETTERPEAITAGAARLVGTAPDNIVKAINFLLDDRTEYMRMAHTTNPYGDGRAAERIIQALRYYFGLADALPSEFKPVV